MRTHVAALVLTALAFLLAGCTVALTPAGEAVREIRDPAQARHCENLGTVASHSMMSNALAAVGMEKTRNEITNETAWLGGDTLLIIKKGWDFNGSYARGVAYRCAQPASATPARPSEPLSEAERATKEAECRRL